MFLPEKGRKRPSNVGRQNESVVLLVGLLVDVVLKADLADKTKKINALEVDNAKLKADVAVLKKELLRVSEQTARAASLP